MIMITIMIIIITVVTVICIYIYIYIFLITMIRRRRIVTIIRIMVFVLIEALAVLPRASRFVFIEGCGEAELFCLWASCVLTQALPEFRQNFTGMSPECRRNFTRTNSISTNYKILILILFTDYINTNSIHILSSPEFSPWPSCTREAELLLK